MQNKKFNGSQSTEKIMLSQKIKDLQSNQGKGFRLFMRGNAESWYT